MSACTVGLAQWGLTTSDLEFGFWDFPSKLSVTAAF